MKGAYTSKQIDRVKGAMTKDEESRHKERYEALLALYLALLESDSEEERQEALYHLAELRMEHAFDSVTEGLKVDKEQALILLQNMEDNTLTQYDADLRDRLDAATSNLIDFSVCEEYHLYEEAREMQSLPIDFDVDDYDDLLLLCQKYNDRYAALENEDVKYAGILAAFWMGVAEADYLVYWTQNDSRVRPTHMALQGYTARKEEFPAWMIPPIEYNCRCYLEILNPTAMAKEELKHVKAAADTLQKPDTINDIYKESLAKCGRIFSDAHPYFQVDEKDMEMLSGFVKRLREKYYGEKRI